MKDQNIRIPDHNFFEEQAKLFMETRRAKQLQKKYQPSPYEEEYKGLYFGAILCSYCCNVISILTASTWLFSYLFSIVQDLPYPYIIAGVIASIVLIFLEVVQRIFGAKFFMFRLQYNKMFYGLLMGALLSGAISAICSFSGGFSLVKTITTPPLYQEPVLEDISLVEKKYQQLIDDAEATAQNYYERRKYGGRIATEDARAYQNYLNKKIAYQDSLLIATDAVSTRNQKKKKEADRVYKEALVAYSTANESKGIGLGGIALVSLALLYLCLWYIEYYDFRTASQYGTLITTAPTSLQATQHYSPTARSPEVTQTPVPTLEEYQKILKMLEAQSIPHKKTTQEENTSLSQKESLNGKEIQNNRESHSLPIGFYSDTERQVQAENLYIQHIQPYIQFIKDIKTVETDKYTVEHKNFKTGEIEHLDFKTVNNRVGIYLVKIKASLHKGNKEVLPNQFSKLQYWLSKRGEFLVQ